MSASTLPGISPADATASRNESISFWRSLLLTLLALVVLLVAEALMLYFWLVPKIDAALQDLIVNSDTSIGDDFRRLDGIKGGPLYDREGNLLPYMDVPNCVTNFPNPDANCPSGPYG